MSLSQVSVSRYRSLQDVQLRPQSLTVLIGPNNAGKSNFADAFDFLGDVYRYGLEIAVSRKGGYEAIAFRRQRRTKAAVAFAVEAEFTIGELRPLIGHTRRLPVPLTPDSRLKVLHSFRLNARRALEGDYKVVEESVEITIPHVAPSRPIVSLHRGKSSFETSVMANLTGQFWSDLLFPFNEEGVRSRFARAPIVDAELIVSARGYVGPLVSQFTRFLSATRLYQLSPLSVRQPGSSTPSPELGRFGDNLPAFVRYLSKTEAWPEVMSVMRRVVPGLESIDTGFSFDRRLTLRFKEEGLSRPWSSAEISDGTLQTLALLCALFDPRSPVVVLEEPENSVHPWIIREFVAACRQTTGKQVLLTSHSPTLVNELEPQEVVVVSRQRGATKVRPLPDLEPMSRSLWESGELKLFDLLDTGLVLDAVPVD